MRNEKGTTLVELLVTLVIFSIVIAGVYGIYTAQVRLSTREYRLAESEMEHQIFKSIIDRDISMAGYGIADNYGSLAFNPIQISATDGTPDTLTLRGTAIGLLSRAAQGWTYITDTSTSPPSSRSWADNRENVESGDRVLYMEPNSKEILGTGIYTFPAGYPSTAERGSLVYDLHKVSATNPYYAVKYLLGGTAPSNCAQGTQNLLRAESRNNDPPVAAEREPILNCVRDFQVAFGLDTNEDGNIDLWDDGGVQTATYTTTKTISARLKQVRAYILVQVANRDPDYTYTNPDPAYAANPDRIWVGDFDLGTGREITLSTEQRRYRWRVVSSGITPRNLR
jgi:prepilin-type N-terminal cleavage/methylation domain-containing protein